MASTSIGVVVGWMADTRRALVRVTPGILIEAAIPSDMEAELCLGARVALVRVEGEEPVVRILVT